MRLAVLLTLLVPALAAAESRVVVPDFDVEGLPPFVAASLSRTTAQNLGKLGCAIGVSRDGLDEPHRAQLRDCFGASSCLADAGSELDASLLVLGDVRRVEGGFELGFLVFSVSAKHAKKRVVQRFAGGLSALKDALRQSMAPLCAEVAALNAKAVSPDAIAALDFDLPIEPPPDAPPPRDELALTLPVTAPPPPPPTAPTPAPPVAKPMAPAPPPAKPAPIVALTPAPRPRPLAVPVAPVPATPPMWRSYAVLGGALAFAVAGGALGYSALGAAQARNATLDRAIYGEEQAAAQSRALGANVSFGAAVVAAAAGGWLWFHDHQESR